MGSFILEETAGTMHSEVSLLSDLREHNIFALNLLNVYLLLLEGGMLPGFQAPDFLKRLSVRLLINKLETEKENSVLSDDDRRTLYAAYVLSNKLLYTDKSEYLSGMITQQLETGHALRDSVRFKEAMISNNERLIHEAETGDCIHIPDFSEWKQAVFDFQVTE